jgi:hypothetical protein
MIDTPYVASGDGEVFDVDSATNGFVDARALTAGWGFVLVADPKGGGLGCYHIGTGDASSIVSETVHETFADDSHGVVFAAGDVTVGLAYHEANGNRVADAGATVTADGGTATSWQTIDLVDAAVGQHRITSTLSTGKTVAFDAEVVDHVDRIDGTPIGSLAPGMALVCFDAYNADRYVEGPTWHVTANGVDATPDNFFFGDNCFDFTVSATDTSVAIVATALDGRYEQDVPVSSMMKPMDPEMRRRAKRARARAR